MSLIDLYPTLVDLCGLSEVEGCEGVSLQPLLNNPESKWERPAVTTWHYKNHSVRSERWRYTEYRDGGRELFDHKSDPGEHRNLADDPQYSEIVASHRRWLPTSDALPAGEDQWRGDSFEKLLQSWSESGGPPEWLE